MEVFNFVKFMWYLDVFYKEPNKISFFFFYKCYLMLYFVLKLFSSSTNETSLTWSMWLSMWKGHLGRCIAKSVLTISRKTQRITKHFQFTSLQVEEIEISYTFYNIQNFLGTSWSSIIATCLIKLLRTGPLTYLQKH